jgi:tripartite-type tricarboxylate transporter receptor subunit TctC
MKRVLLRLASIATLGAGALSAQAFPDKPITLIVPFGAGTSVDANGRDVALALGALDKVTAIVDNRAGAEGAIGAKVVLNAPADGHTLMVTSSSITVLDPLLKKGMQFDPIKDFVPICTIARTGIMANVTGANPIKSTADLIATAKAQPGKLTFAYSSATTRLAGELFAQAAGVTLTGVPYKASAAGLTDVASGVVDLFFIDHVSVAPLLQGGKVRPLVMAGDKRLSAMPQVPSAVEEGVPGFTIKPWFAVYASAKTPPATVAKLRELLTQALNAPSAKTNMEKRGQEPLLLCGDAMAKFQADEIELWRGVLKKAGIEPQ